MSKKDKQIKPFVKIAKNIPGGIFDGCPEEFNAIYYSTNTPGDICYEAYIVVPFPSKFDDQHLIKLANELEEDIRRKKEDD